MNAAVFNRNELTFEEDHADPRPGEGECVVRVQLAGICSTDLHITHGYMDFSGILGHELVGTVVRGSPEWEGKRVVCEINCVCRRCSMCQAGLSNHCLDRTVIGISGRDGCFAELIAVPELNLHAVPDVLTDEQAVFVEPLAAAYQVPTQVKIDARTTVSVLGPGRLGLLVAQVLRNAGCQLNVIGRSKAKLLLCEKNGIQAVHLDEVNPRNDRDVVVDCTGDPMGLELAMRLVRPRGTIVLKSTFADPGDVNLAPLVINEVNLIGSRCGPFAEAIDALAREAVEVRSMISKTFPLERVEEAFQAAGDSSNVKVLLKIGAQ